MTERFDPLSIVSKLADQEKQLVGSTFLAPVIAGGKVRLRLNGIICELEVDKSVEEGWAIMEVESMAKARFKERASISLISQYLKLFPKVRLVMLGRFDSHWWAVAASGGQQQLQLNGPVPVNLAGKVSAFDTVYARFDGGNIWFENNDRRRDPSVARQLREALANEVDPAQLHVKGMTPQERLTYKMLWLDKHEDADAPKDDSTRIAEALTHAGARLDAFWYDASGQEASVRFVRDGRTHVIQIRPNDLSVVSAGVCLQGREADFDLASIVGVLREAENREYFDDY
jgi:hypothetical protein